MSTVSTFWYGPTALSLVLAAVGCGDDAGSGGDGSGLSGSGASGASGTGATGSGANGGGGAGGNGSGAGPDIDPGCSGDPTVHEGEATYYDFADGSGNCSFPATPNDLMVGAMNDTDYAASAVCGACAAIDGPDGSVTVRIVDRCPECPQGDIDLSPEAFELIAELSAGRVPISWTYTDCDVSGPIRYFFKEGSNPYWTAVQIRNHTYAIASVEAKDANGDYVDIPRVDYNFFVAESGLGEGPYDFRVTDVAGHVLEDSGIAFMEAAEVAGAGQFPVCGGP